jgi:Na+/proline symporter
MIVLAVVLSDRAGGVEKVITSMPAENFKFLPSFGLKEIVTYLAAWSVLGLGSLPSQDVFQRSMSSNSVKTAVLSCHIAAFLYLTIAILPLFISLCIKHLYPSQILEDSQLALPAMVIQHTALPIQILFFGSLLSAIMSTTSSSILAPAAICSENIARPLSKQRFTDRHLLWVTRTSILLFSLLATIMACLRSNIYELVSESSILSLVSLFVPLTLGLYWKKASSVGALLSMVIGMLTWIIFEAFDSEWPSLVPATLASFAGMLVGSMAWPDKKKVDEN